MFRRQYLFGTFLLVALLSCRLCIGSACASYAKPNVHRQCRRALRAKGAHFSSLTALFVTLFRNKSVTKIAVREVKCAPLIGKTSAVSYNVLGHAKLVSILTTGYLYDITRNVYPTQNNIIGVVLALIGIFSYSYVKIVCAPTPAAEDKKKK